MLGILLLCPAAFFLYTGNYYHADPVADKALISDSDVSVSREAYGWLCDRPSEDSALIFYPGGKVEAAAYAPLLHRLAADGMDAMLVEMPFRLAVFGTGKAENVIEAHDYRHWYIGGHSLGGVIAADYAADHEDAVEGVVLLAAYPSKKLADSLTEISIYGSHDRVLNMTSMEKAKVFASFNFREHVIRGGNHAQFGNYGPQRGDGTAKISADAQQQETVRLLLQDVGKTE
jgi:hypothetical protein